MAIVGRADGRAKYTHAHARNFEATRASAENCRLEISRARAPKLETTRSLPEIEVTQPPQPPQPSTINQPNTG